MGPGPCHSGPSKVAPVPGTENVADIGTKVLSAERIDFLKKKINVRDVKDLIPAGRAAHIFVPILHARMKAPAVAVAVLATGANSGEVVIAGQQSDVCRGVATMLPLDAALTSFAVGLVVGLALACCCLRPFWQRASQRDNMAVLTYEKASQSQVTYSRNAMTPRFRPLPESSHG